MVGKEVAQLALGLKETPRLPVTLVAGGEWYVNHAKKTFSQIKNDPRAIADVFIDAYRTLGHDLMWTGAGLLNYPVHCLGCEISDDSSSSPSLIGSVIQELDEIESLSADEALSGSLLGGIIDAQHIIADEIGRETLILPTHWGPFTTASRILGMESFLVGMLDDPDKLKELIRFSADYLWAIGERLLEHENIAGLNFSEPVASGDLISPASFQEFVKPVLADLTSRLKERGKYAMIHICGDSTRILPDILDIAPHAFSLESKTPLATAKQSLGGKVCVTGNVTPAGVFLSGSPEDVIAEARGCVETWGKDPGFILSVGCDFPKEVPLKNAKALMSLKN